MKINTEKAIILVLIIVTVILSLLLVQSQNTIESQRTTIATQEAKISELESEVAKLSTVTPERIINDVRDILKDQGVDFLRTLSEKALQQ